MTGIVLGSFLFTAIVLVLSLTVLGARRLLLPEHDVTITVNAERALHVKAGGKLLSQLQEAGIPLPSACAGAGTCGLCRVTVTEGGGTPLPTETGKLNRAELRDGVRMACQVVTRDDMAIEVPPELFGVRTFTCTVVSNDTVAPFIKELVLAPPAETKFTFDPGAFVQLTAPDYNLSFADIEVGARHKPIWERLKLAETRVASEEPVTRAYSVASAPEDGSNIVLNVRLALPPPNVPNAPPGLVSSYLFALKAGDTVEVSGPYGHFHAQDTDREMVFIGGGVGMAPLRAIIFDQLERQNTGRRMTFWYGARSHIEIYHADEFARLAAEHDNFDWTVALSDPKPEDKWDGATGFIHAVALERYLRNHPAPEDCEYYLCGPPLMIRAVLAMLDDLGVEPESIFNDDFGS